MYTRFIVVELFLRVRRIRIVLHELVEMMKGDLAIIRRLWRVGHCADGEDLRCELQGFECSILVEVGESGLLQLYAKAQW